ncbi:hypothetical protein AgCh_039249 [Apium graveolens]
MVDVKGDGGDGLSGLVDTSGLEKGDLELNGVGDGEDIGGRVVGENEENNGGGLVEGEERGEGKEVEEESVVVEERVEGGKEGGDVGEEEKKSEENGVAMEKEGGLEIGAGENGGEGVEKNDNGIIEAANNGVDGIEKNEGGIIEAANNGEEGIEKNEGGIIEAANDGGEGLEKKEAGIIEAANNGVEAVEMEGGKIEGYDKGKGVEISENKVDEKSTPKGRKPKKRIRKKKVVQGVSKVLSKDEEKPESSSAQKKIEKKVVKTVVSKNEDKPESSKGKKNSKKVESMGMIFMCTSQTKKDCYRYKLLGLPAAKKELVDKIYKGMRLFLFDLDLRLLYGIYKAAAPGGTNIEPKAFKSAFPSQVRFTVLEDCLPLAEEKFKEAIKENYYSRNKFDCQLNSEQVKKLCKLFVSVNKGSALPKISRSLVVGRISEGLKQQSREEKRGRKRRDRDEGSSRKQRDRGEDRGRKRRGRREERKSPPRREQQRHNERPVIYANEVSYSQVAPLHGGYQLPAPVYTYERTLEMNPYRREQVLEHRGLQVVDREPRHPGVQVVDREPRHRDETKNIDPYISYREREAPSFRRPIYSSASEREYYTPEVWPAAYLPAGRESERHTTSGLRDYYQPGTLPPEYLPSRREIEYIPSRREVEYRTTAELPAEYHSTRALPAEYRASRSLLAEYRAAGLPTEDLAPAGVSNGYHLAGPATEYRSSAGGLRDYRPLQTTPRYR